MTHLAGNAAPQLDAPVNLVRLCWVYQGRLRLHMLLGVTTQTWLRIYKQPWSFSASQFVERRRTPVTAFAILLQKDNLWQQSNKVRHGTP